MAKTVVQTPDGRRHLVEAVEFNPIQAQLNATHSHLANSPLASQFTNRSNSVTAMTTTTSYDYLNRLLSIGNASTPVWTNVQIIASLTGTNQTISGSLLHPKATELFTFDADGNQASDSLWTNSWDGENRLLVTESASGVPSGGKAREAWTLDGQSRWVHRVIYTWDGSAYTWPAPPTGSFGTAKSCSPSSTTPTDWFIQSSAVPT